MAPLIQIPHDENRGIFGEIALILILSGLIGGFAHTISEDDLLL